MQARLLTIRDVADYLAVSQNTVRRMAERGDLPPPLRLSSGVIRWDRAAIDRMLDARGKGGGQYDDPDAALADL